MVASPKFYQSETLTGTLYIVLDNIHSVQPGFTCMLCCGQDGIKYTNHLQRCSVLIYWPKYTSGMQYIRSIVLIYLRLTNKWARASS